MPEDTNIRLSHLFLNVIVTSRNLNIVFVIAWLLNAGETACDSNGLYNLENIPNTNIWSGLVNSAFINGS